MQGANVRDNLNNWALGNPHAALDAGIKTAASVAGDLPTGRAVRRPDQAGQDLVLRGDCALGFDRAASRVPSTTRCRARPTSRAKGVVGPTPTLFYPGQPGTPYANARLPDRPGAAGVELRLVSQPRGTRHGAGHAEEPHQRLRATSRSHAAARRAHSPARTRSNRSAAGTGTRRASCRARGPRRSPAVCCSRPARRGRRPTG